MLEIDTELKTILNSSTTTLSLKRIKIPVDVKIFCDVSTKEILTYITPDFRKPLFDILHGLSHPGIQTTLNLLKSRFVWPSISKDVHNWTICCIACQKFKINRHTKRPIGNFDLPTQCFKYISIDLVGPLLLSKGYRFVLTCIDRFTRWVEAIPLEEINAEAVASAFCNVWMSRYGVPSHITTDQGRQFESALFQEFGKLLRIKVTHTTIFHPQSNGQIERWDRTLKAAIKSYKNIRWVDVLLNVMIGTACNCHAGRRSYSC